MNLLSQNEVKNIVLPTVVVFAEVIFPTTVHAQTIKTFLQQVKSIADLLVPIVVGLVVIFFFWGVALFILNSGDSKQREDGRRKMLWGIIAMFVVLSILPIIQMIGSFIGVEPCLTPELCYAPN